MRLCRCSGNTLKMDRAPAWRRVWTMRSTSCGTTASRRSECRSLRWTPARRTAARPGSVRTARRSFHPRADRRAGCTRRTRPAVCRSRRWPPQPPVGWSQ
uniref:(northern house mosquito) hypothetical protein n=1 Tax=Culex pipiens TaxID=7175 RepID=A0A8D8AQD8_CULPI